MFHQPDRLTLLRQLLIDAGVVASKGAHADYSDVNKLVVQFLVLQNLAAKDFPYPCPAFFSSAIWPAW